MGLSWQESKEGAGGGQGPHRQLWVRGLLEGTPREWGGWDDAGGGDARDCTVCNIGLQYGCMQQAPKCCLTPQVQGSVNAAGR